MDSVPCLHGHPFSAVWMGEWREDRENNIPLTLPCSVSSASAILYSPVEHDKWEKRRGEGEKGGREGQKGIMRWRESGRRERGIEEERQRWMDMVI